MRCSFRLSMAALASAVLLGCVDQSPPTSPDLEAPVGSHPTAAVVTTELLLLHGEAAVARFFVPTEDQCVSTEIVIVATESGQLQGRDPSFGELVFVAINEDNFCTGEFTQWAGEVTSGFTQQGLKSARLSTPITLTNNLTGETRTFTVNLSWSGTGQIFNSTSTANQPSEGQRGVFFFSDALRFANLTTAELIEGGTNLLADASPTFVVLSNSSSGSLFITY
jgi:hypothetical protein